jgi:hypothetical protein
MLANLHHWADYLQMTLWSDIQIRIACCWKNVIDHGLNEIDIWSKKWLMSFNPEERFKGWDLCDSCRYVTICWRITFNSNFLSSTF